MEWPWVKSKDTDSQKGQILLKQYNYWGTWKQMCIFKIVWMKICLVLLMYCLCYCANEGKVKNIAILTLWWQQLQSLVVQARCKNLWKREYSTCGRRKLLKIKLNLGSCFCDTSTTNQTHCNCMTFFSSNYMNNTQQTLQPSLEYLLIWHGCLMLCQNYKQEMIRKLSAQTGLQCELQQCRVLSERALQWRNPNVIKCIRKKKNKIKTERSKLLFLCFFVFVFFFLC